MGSGETQEFGRARSVAENISMQVHDVDHTCAAGCSALLNQAISQIAVPSTMAGWHVL